MKPDLNIPEFNLKNVAATILGGITGIAAVALVLSSYTVVPEGHRGVLLRLNHAIEVVPQGLNFKIPFVDTIRPISIMADRVEIQGAEGATKDTQPVYTSLVVRYSIRPDAVLKVFVDYSQSGDLDNYIETSAQEVFKSVTAGYSADNLIMKRQEVSNKVVSVLQQKVVNYGATIIAVDMTKFSFSNGYMTAINAKVTEEQQKLAEQNKLERIRVEQQQKVVVAEAEAQATIATSTAKARAMEIEAKALRENSNILEMRKIEVSKLTAEKWNGVGPTTVFGSGGAVPMVNIGGK